MNDDHDHSHQEYEDEENFQELMPEQSPSNATKILYITVALITIGLVFSPIITFFLLGIEASVAFFLTGLLVLLVQW